MDCPNCQVKMNEIKTKSHYGANVFIDQCPECGGVWFENMELYEVDKDLIKSIDQIDSSKLTGNAIINPELYCPKDKAKLLSFSDPSFPAALKVESCSECGGFFFNRGEFAFFSEERKKRLAEKDIKMDDKLSERVEKLLGSASSSSSYDALGNLGRFLSRKYYQGPSGAILPFDTINQNTRDADKASETAMAVLSVIRLLLRLFLKI